MGGPVGEAGRQGSETARVFVAAWPPGEVRAALASLPRPEHPALRWVLPGHWHVTLRFLGDAVPVSEIGALTVALAGAAAAVTPEQAGATAGPATVELGAGALVIPVAGLDALAAAVEGATAAPVRPFSGHLTVARARGRRGRIPDVARGIPFHAAWTVSSVELIRSRLGSAGPTYEVLASLPVGGR